MYITNHESVLRRSEEIIAGTSFGSACFGRLAAIPTVHGERLNILCNTMQYTRICFDNRISASLIHCDIPIRLSQPSSTFAAFSQPTTSLQLCSCTEIDGAIPKSGLGWRDLPTTSIPGIIKRHQRCLLTTSHNCRYTHSSRRRSRVLLLRSCLDRLDQPLSF